MTVSNSRRLALLTILQGLLLAFLPPLAEAQPRPAPVGEFGAGAFFFADDGVVTEGALDGAARFYVGRRVSVGPELAYVSGDGHSHLTLTGNVTVDLMKPPHLGSRRVMPFAVVGGGLFQTREQFPTTGVFTSTEGAFTAGGGVRARVGRWGFIGAEARVGWELHIRLRGSVGVHLGRPRPESNARSR